MSNRISVDELTERLPDILDQVRERGEHIVIERDGVPLATLAPPEPGKARNWKEFVERLAAGPQPDDEFADDLEAIQAEANRAPLQTPEWPS